MSIFAGLYYWCEVLWEPLHWGAVIFIAAVCSIALSCAVVTLRGRLYRGVAMFFSDANLFLGAWLILFAIIGGIPLPFAPIETSSSETAIVAALILSMAAAQRFVWRHGHEPAPELEVFARRTGAGILALIAAGIVWLATITASGWNAARTDAPAHQARAAELRDNNRSSADLGDEARRNFILQIVDPNFLTHNGMDALTPYARMDTITETIAPQLDSNRRGGSFWRFRRAGYALGLETRLSKDDILSLYLDTVSMGRRSPEDRSIIYGFFEGSEVVFGKGPAALSEREFLTLVAIMTGPLIYSHHNDFDKQRIDAHVLRLERLLAGECAPLYKGDQNLYRCSPGRLN